MKAGAETHTGLVRPANEDAYCIVPDPAGDYLLLAVADGMGGHEGGEIASALALSELGRCVASRMNDTAANPIAVLAAAMDSANTAVYRTSVHRLGMSGATLGLGMGTTLTSALVVGFRLYIGHVGDSRVYLWRDRQLRLLTQDHSLVAEMVRDGEIGQDAAEQDPRRHVLTRAVGTQEQVVSDLTSVELNPGDRVLICSDGLSGVVSEQVLANILETASSCDGAAAALVQRALEAGGPDNVTAIVLFVTEKPAGQDAGGRHD